METYFKMKFWTEYIIPIIVLCFLAVLLIVYITYSLIMQDIKYSYLKKHGYERKPYIQNKTVNVSVDTYKWVRGDKSISESRVDMMKLSELKEYVRNASEH